MNEKAESQATLKKERCNPGERMTALLIIILGMLGYYFAMDMTSETYYSPSVVPKLTSVVVAICAAAALFRTRSKDKNPLNWYGTLKYFLPKDVLVLLTFLVIYSFMLPLAGFNIASAAFLFAAMAYLQNWKDLIRAAIISVITVAVLYLVFRYLFLVILP